LKEEDDAEQSSKSSDSNSDLDKKSSLLEPGTIATGFDNLSGTAGGGSSLGVSFTTLIYSIENKRSKKGSLGARNIILFLTLLLLLISIIIAGLLVVSNTKSQHYTMTSFSDSLEGINSIGFLALLIAKLRLKQMNIVDDIQEIELGYINRMNENYRRFMIALGNDMKLDELKGRLDYIDPEINHKLLTGYILNTYQKATRQTKKFISSENFLQTSDITTEELLEIDLHIRRSLFAFFEDYAMSTISERKLYLFILGELLIMIFIFNLFFILIIKRAGHVRDVLLRCLSSFDEREITFMITAYQKEIQKVEDKNNLKYGVMSTIGNVKKKISNRGTRLTANTSRLEKVVPSQGISKFRISKGGKAQKSIGQVMQHKHSAPRNYHSINYLTVFSISLILLVPFVIYILSSSRTLENIRDLIGIQQMNFKSLASKFPLLAIGFNQLLQTFTNYSISESLRTYESFLSTEKTETTVPPEIMTFLTKSDAANTDICKTYTINLVDISSYCKVLNNGEKVTLPLAFKLLYKLWGEFMNIQEKEYIGYQEIGNKELLPRIYKLTELVVHYMSSELKEMIDKQIMEEISYLESSSYIILAILILATLLAITSIDIYIVKKEEKRMEDTETAVLIPPIQMTVNNVLAKNYYSKMFLRK